MDNLHIGSQIVCVNMGTHTNTPVSFKCFNYITTENVGDVDSDLELFLVTC